MIFFFDHCLSRRYADRLRDAYNADVRVLKDHFPADAPDEVWLPEIGKRGWILVTEDNKIRAKPQERLALRQSGVTAFFLGKSFGELKLMEKGEALVQVWPKIQSTAQACAPGSFYVVNVRGNVEPVTLPVPFTPGSRGSS